MLNLRFKRPYVRHDFGDNLEKTAIVTYGRMPWTARACDHGEQGHEVIVEYRKKLRLDLWLVTFDFEWVGKGDSCPNLKTTSQASE